MYFKKIESKGLAHFSYIIGDGNEAAIIDPRRDVEEYLDSTRREGLKIKYIFETHRNEDYVIGSKELGEKSGAKVFISGYEDLGYEYGEEIFDGEAFDVGELTIKAIHTPGHTLGHMSYALYEKDQETPLMVFTGDCLFFGDMGRTDFYGEENLEKMTGLLYDSVIEKLLPLGDGVLVFPAHGPGSACGEDMADRPYSTLGYEKEANPYLQVSSKEEFIEKFASMRIKPRYFEKMEVFNVKGAPFINGQITLSAIELEEAMEKDYVILDCRSKEAFWGGHIPGAYFLSGSNFSKYAGTIFELDTPLVLCTISTDEYTLDELYWMGRRIGFDNIKGYLKEGVNSLIDMGKSPVRFPTISPEDFVKVEGDHILLDIRMPDSEIHEKLKKNLVNIPLQELYKKLDKLEKNKKIYVLCASSDRATTGAAFLKNEGYDSVVITGGYLALEPLL
ncbi:MAG: MBL fold metallo-hydrolase [Tissierellia bacterium]|nr:MBL fold metallo-hydrolase [Tissierellia bacterium]